MVPAITNVLTLALDASNPWASSATSSLLMPTESKRNRKTTDGEFVFSDGACKIYLIATLQNGQQIVQLDEGVQTIVDLDCQFVNNSGSYTIITFRTNTHYLRLSEIPCDSKTHYQLSQTYAYWALVSYLEN